MDSFPFLACLTYIENMVADSLIVFKKYRSCPVTSQWDQLNGLNEVHLAAPFCLQRWPFHVVTASLSPTPTPGPLFLILVQRLASERTPDAS